MQTQYNLQDYNIENERQEKVVGFLKEYIKSPLENLIFYGNCGTGKTYLSMCVGNEIYKLHGSNIIERVNLPDMIDDMRDAVYEKNNAKINSIKENFRKRPILILDECDKIEGNKWQQGQLLKIINHRCELKRPTIMISNASPRQLGEILGEPIIDRMKQGKVVLFNWDSYRGRKDVDNHNLVAV